MPVAVVTGASSGIGRAAAVRIAEQGIGVIVTYNSNPDGIRDTVTEVEKAGGTAVALRLDLGDASSFAAFRADVVAALRSTWSAERLDFLVNNAGISGAAPFGETPEELFDTLARVLLKGPYFLTQALLPVLADGGAVVNVSSNAGTAGDLQPGFSAYAAMKGGVTALTRYVAKELSPRGIRVNAVSPGPTRTRLGDDGFERFPELIPGLAAKTALGRLGEPDDIAVLITALLGDAGRWVTAQNIEASGGFTL